MEAKVLNILLEELGERDGYKWESKYLANGMANFTEMYGGVAQEGLLYIQKQIENSRESLINFQNNKRDFVEGKNSYSLINNSFRRGNDRREEKRFRIFHNNRPKSKRLTEEESHPIPAVHYDSNISAADKHSRAKFTESNKAILGKGVSPSAR